MLINDTRVVACHKRKVYTACLARISLTHYEIDRARNYVYLYLNVYVFKRYNVIDEIKVLTSEKRNERKCVHYMTKDECMMC